MVLTDVAIRARGKINCLYNYKYTRKDGSGKLCGRSYSPGTVFQVLFNKQLSWPGVVPVSINNPEGQPYREKMKAAVLAWQNLSIIDKTYWNNRFKLDRERSGYNHFISDYILNN